jgi:putative membrane protein
MPSDQRFHPFTVLFALGSELRNFLGPIVFASFTARSRGGEFENWLLIFMIPSVAIAAARYWFSTYRYDETELVVRTGIFFKNERHIPYARIQSVDARQNVLHRVLQVVEVQVRTGTGGDAEATLSVLPFGALEQMRQRVFEGRKSAAEGAPSEATDSPDVAPATDTEAATQVTPIETPADVLLRLTPADTALSGLLDNRGWVVIGAASGLLWESGVFDRVETLLPQASWTIAAAVAAGLFVVSPILSVFWALVRLHGFTLTRRGAELLTEYGGLTRVTGTIPLRRVQAIKVFQTPGHRLTKRAAVRVETAGGAIQRQGGGEREWIAPIIRVESVPALVEHLAPNVTFADVEWQSPDVAAGTRRMRLAAIWSLITGLVALRFFDWSWALTATLVLLAFALFAARKYVQSLGWARTDEAVYFRSGWLWRAVTIVPIAKVQGVELTESPFDRRWSMASVSVDTAGAGAHQVDVPYLGRDVAEGLRTALLAQVAATEFRW